MSRTDNNRPKFFEAEWIEKRTRLLTVPRFRAKLAEVFHANARSSYWTAERRILYIGKATAGPYEPQREDKFYFGCNHGAFWSLARRLGSRLASSSADLDPIAWSNLLKIGTVRGNPSYGLAEQQHDLSVKTLQAEIKHFSPSLIFCVAANYRDEVLYEALGTKQHQDGFVEEKVFDRKLYFRQSMDGFPPVIWIDHPQGKKHEYLDRAVELASQLAI